VVVLVLAVVVDGFLVVVRKPKRLLQKGHAIFLVVVVPVVNNLICMSKGAYNEIHEKYTSVITGKTCTYLRVIFMCGVAKPICRKFLVHISGNIP